jgi:hypothetical protein
MWTAFPSSDCYGSSEPGRHCGATHSLSGADWAPTFTSDILAALDPCFTRSVCPVLYLFRLTPVGFPPPSGDHKAPEGNPALSH